MTRTRGAKGVKHERSAAHMRSTIPRQTSVGRVRHKQCDTSRAHDAVAARTRGLDSQREWNVSHVWIRAMRHASAGMVAQRHETRQRVQYASMGACVAIARGAAWAGDGGGIAGDIVQRRVN